MTNMENKNENQTLLFFFPLKVTTYSEYEYGVCGSDDPPQEITSADAVDYKEEILTAIEKENRHFENDRGLAEYIDTATLQEKVQSLYPSVEEWNGELWGVMTAVVTSKLTEPVGQNSDGYGEGFEQRPIKTQDGEIYVSFWNSDRYFLTPEQELKQEAPNLENSEPVMGGM